VIKFERFEHLMQLMRRVGLVPAVDASSIVRAGLLLFAVCRAREGSGGRHPP
jgi:hypothetical protein